VVVSAANGTNARGKAALIDFTFALADRDGEIPSILSNSGLSLSIIVFQSAVCCSSEGLAEPGDGGNEGVYFKTMSVQRWKTASVMCNCQLTASRKAISFWLISKVFNPEILLHALAE